MLIANPIYDAVFKYLMDDLPVARIIISTIIGEKVEALEFKQRERSAQVATLGVSVFRLDFSAVIRTADGSLKNVLIEIQKADRGEDLARFRRYLAENYYTPAAKMAAGAAEDTVPAPVDNAPLIPIITIYILGFPLKQLRGRSAVMVKRRYYDAVTGDEIQEREDFIEHLTHDSYVIQISELKQRRRNKLEHLLALFEQMNLEANQHLKVFEGDLPAEFQVVLDRLYRAALDRAIRSQMEVEDEFLGLWKRNERLHERALEEAKQREQEAKQREQEAKKLEHEIQLRWVEERRLKEKAMAELAELRRQLGRNEHD